MPRQTLLTANRLAHELSEDIDVAIREFLERHPDVGPPRIRQAMRLVARRAYGRRASAAVVWPAVLAAFVVGITLGLVLGLQLPQ